MLLSLSLKSDGIDLCLAAVFQQQSLIQLYHIKNISAVAITFLDYILKF